MTKPTAAEIPDSSWLFFENIFMTQFPQKSFAIKSRTFWIFDNLHISKIAILIFIRWGWVGQMDLTELSCNIETNPKKVCFISILLQTDTLHAIFWTWKYTSVYFSKWASHTVPCYFHTCLLQIFSDATLIAHFGVTHFTFWIFLWKIM